MTINKAFQLLGLSLVGIFSATTAHAVSVDWTGTYRAEWVQVDKPSLGEPTNRKAYGLNHLYLSPNIIAMDGVNIRSKIHLLNSNQYADSQLGDIWGRSNTGISSGNQGTSDISVSQLYLTVNQEYGALIVGRAPYDFGLGLSYSSGQDLFDHWYNTRDIIGYKIVVGNWFFMPSLGRKQAVGYGQNGTISLMGLHLEYQTEDKKSKLAIFQENSKGVDSAIHYSQSQLDAYGGAGSTKANNLDIQKTNFMFGRQFDSFGLKFEAGFQSGDAGVMTATNEKVSLSGFGLALEVEVPAMESKWDYRLKMGMASGHDGAGKDFGAFAFNPNYDVAMLLFNHKIGQVDFLNSNVTRYNNYGLSQSADDEVISNAMYIAPSVNYAWSDKVHLRNTLIFGQLMQTQNSSVDSSKDLGLEWDIDVVYKHSKNIQWVNQVGLLFPGEAWKNGTGAGGNLPNDFTFGFASKAAISF